MQTSISYRRSKRCFFSIIFFCQKQILIVTQLILNQFLQQTQQYSLRRFCNYITTTSRKQLQVFTLRLHLSFGSQRGEISPFSRTYTGYGSCEVQQLNTSCSIPQSKQQPRLPFKSDSQVTSSKGSISGQKYLRKTDLLVFIMIPTQCLLRSTVFQVPCLKSRV